MENLSNRFPHLSSNIFNELNDQSVFNCKESSRKINNFIGSEKFFWLRIIQKYRGNFVEFNDPWNKIIKKSSINFVKELSQAIYRFFTKRSSRFEIQWHPLYVVGDQGCLQLFKCVYEKIVDKNPKGCSGSSVLHIAAQEGHLDICKFILENVGGKSFLDDIGFTPLYRAAGNGQVEACKLLLNYFGDKNLGSNVGTYNTFTCSCTQWSPTSIQSCNGLFC